jgi:hypothetical protein
MIASRILAALAALFLVTAVAIASLTPLGMTLGQGLMLMDGGWLAWMQKHSIPWAWTWVELPFLLRPLWLIPATIGLICVGAAASLSFGKASPSRRKRS